MHRTNWNEVDWIRQCNVFYQYFSLFLCPLKILKMTFLQPPESKVSFHRITPEKRQFQALVQLSIYKPHHPNNKPIHLFETVHNSENEHIISFVSLHCIA